MVALSKALEIWVIFLIPLSAKLKSNFG